LIFANPATKNTLATAWLGAICYTFQIFFDFSGYSDMAIGLGKMFGFDFLENFNYPYISKSITEFWRRWHISLSTWFRDYVYIPLGGNRKGNVYVNLIIVFIITGFWHGASFNFLIWGLWHGLFLIIERVFKIAKTNKKSNISIKYFYTMLVVIVGWVFFRVENLQEAKNYLGIMFGLIEPVNVGFTAQYYISLKLICILVIGAFASTPWHKTRFFVNIFSRKISQNVKAVAILVVFVISCVFVVSSSYNPFIYFRF
jgi:alginate O-acetyltransferase complex protein AlgI